MMQIRPARFEDLPALVTLERTATLAAAPQAYPSAASFPLTQHLAATESEFSDPWITFTVAEDAEGLCGWVKYTEDQLRHLVIADRMQGTDLRDQLYSEGLRHWRTGAVTGVRQWLLAEDWRARAYFETHRWVPTGRVRRSAFDPHPVLAEYLLTPNI